MTEHHPPAWLCILGFVVFGVIPGVVIWVVGNRALNELLKDPPDRPGRKET